MPLRPPDEAAWEETMRQRLAACLPAWVPGDATVVDIRPLADDVSRVRFADGGCVVVKHQFYGLLTRGEPWDLLHVERDALRQLRAAGCPVPWCFGIDPEAQLICLEYAGAHTVADLLVGPAAVPSGLGRRLLAGLVRVEDVLARALPAWAPRVAPGASVADLRAAWAGVAATAVDALRRLWRGRLGAQPPAACSEAIVDLATALGRRPPRLGVTDYQSANVVVDAAGVRVTFLEFAKLGWDWTERRAVQYTTSLDGSGSTLLEAGGLADLPVDAGALDGHLLLFQLLSARHLPQERPPIGLLHSLATSWSPDPRVLRLRQALSPLTLPLETAA